MFSAELARLQRQVEEASNMLHSERQTPQILSAVATPLSRHRSTESMAAESNERESANEGAMDNTAALFQACTEATPDDDNDQNEASSGDM